MNKTQNVSTILDVKRVRVLVSHGGYGCDTGCCGHYVELEDGTQIGSFAFSHPWSGKDDFREWAIELAQDAVTERFGAEHVADLDWENSLVVDD